MSKALVAIVFEVDEADVLTAKEAASMLGIQHASALKAAERETLRGQKVGSMWFFVRTDVEQYRSKQCKTKTPS